LVRLPGGEGLETGAQYEYKENPDAQICRIGLTVEKVNTYIVPCVT
jgi:hypothetical protein